MNTTVLLSLLSSAVFTAAAVVLIRRKHHVKLSSGIFTPLLLSLFLYDFIVFSNFLEHSGISGYFDPLEDIAEIVFTLVFLFFVNNWRKDRSEARFRELFKLAPMSLAEVARDGRILQINEILEKKLNDFFGITIEEMPTLNKWWELAYPDPERRQMEIASWQKAVDLAHETGAEINSEESEVICRDGTKRTMIVGVSIIGDNYLLSMVDITDRKREEADRMESLELLRATFDATPDGILVVNHEMKVTQANQQFYKMWRIPDYLQNTDDSTVMREFVVDQLEDPVGFRNIFDRLDHSGIQDVYEIPFKDGRVFECYSAPMAMDEDKIGWVWDFRDISRQKEAEAEQEKLQGQLLQAQKLEAIGILAGGIAHDFNNIIGAIIGYAELTMQGMASDNPDRENLANILDAAHRSAALTRHLLIFARKQTVTPITLDLNASVATMLGMLQRLIGENIELVWLPAKTPCTVKMDPSQLDQILANLCVNARDAITDVGQVTIMTDRVFFNETDCKINVDCFPGKYVQLTVRDNGSGIDKDTVQHIFEPFFTTKEVGRGTGLGLAAVYGIVKQNSGFINLYSEPGMGATFNIFIPLLEDGAVPEPAETDGAIPRGRGETILMVEDDPTIIAMGQMMLKRLGYEVLTARTPGEAIQLAEETKGPIHLFLTDVVMPEMNGRELVDHLLLIRPGVKHLFMSGYTADVMIHRGVFEEERYFIQKPFTLKDMAVKVREVLTC